MTTPHHLFSTRLDRRTALRGALAAGGALAASSVAAQNASASCTKTQHPGNHPTGRTLRVLVATNEPWGTYHVAALVAELGTLTRRCSITSVVPDRSQITATDPVPVATLDEAAGMKADLLVVNGATDWPLQVAQRLSGLPVVASSFAYLTATESPLAAQLRPRIVAYTAQSSSEAAVFAAHFGVPVGRVQVVGNVKLDSLPAYAPVAGTVLIATSVTRSSVTGGAAPGAQLLLDTAAALAAAGKHVRVGLHPREDPSLWSAYEIATEGTTAAAATAEVTVGIPGSVFPNVAAIGCPLVGTVAPGLTVPDYILDLCTPVHTVQEALTAVAARALPSQAALEAAVGPLGGSGQRLVDAWEAAVRLARRGHRS